jgi:excisionase family DNA binding protein
MTDQLLTAKEAAKLLGVSPPTFKKIIGQYAVPGIQIGARIKFARTEILKILNLNNPPGQLSPLPSLNFTVFHDILISGLEIYTGIFDLRTIKLLDPYGVVSLLCTLIQKCRSGQKIELLIEDNKTTQYLRSIGFFQELESECEGKIRWDSSVLKSSVEFPDEPTLVPIRGIKLKGDEKIIAERLIELLRQQGFSQSVGRKVAHIIGELADNALTHSNALVSDRKCFILAKRFIYKNNAKCIIVGLADVGQGIHNSLRTNPKHSKYSDKKALLESFRPYVSSWDDSAKRGKGLTDVLSITWGNQSFLRVDSGPVGLFMDFHDGEKITFRNPATDVEGTRYGIVLIDNEFDRRTRGDVDKLVTNISSKL